MKRCIILLIIVLSLFLCFGSFASAEKADWTAEYAKVLDEKQAEELTTTFGDSLCCYTPYDIDKDGTPELIVKMGTCEADFHGYIYTMSNGQALCICDDLGLGHSSLYSDPNENGMILMHGHMGYAWAERISLASDGALSFEELYEDDLNKRLATDPDADYVYPGEVIPGAAYLDMSPLELRLPITRYVEIEQYRAGVFPAAGGNFPFADPDYYDKVIRGNHEVLAVSADGYARSPGRVGFQELLKKDVAADWMSEDLKILSTQLADLDGDGWLDCIVNLSKGDTSDCMRFFLTVQEGTVYAYLQNYAPQEVTVDANGNILSTSEYYSDFRRLIFNGDEAMLLTLPMEYYAA